MNQELTEEQVRQFDEDGARSLLELIRSTFPTMR